MNKDALLATLIGFGVGLIITGMFLLGPSLVKSIPKITIPKISFPKKIAKPALAPTPVPTEQILTISSPLPDAIESKNDLLVSGSANPDSIVIVQGSTDEEVVSVKEDGLYAGKVTLSEGKNDIVVTGYIEGKSLSRTVTVYFTEEKL